MHEYPTWQEATKRRDKLQALGYVVRVYSPKGSDFWVVEARRTETTQMEFLMHDVAEFEG